MVNGAEHHKVSHNMHDTTSKPFLLSNKGSSMPDLEGFDSYQCLTCP